MHQQEQPSPIGAVDVDGIGLLEGIPHEKQNAVLRCLSATVSHFDKGALLASAQRETRFTRYLLSGSARITRIDCSGNRSILGTIGKGSLVDSDLTPLLYTSGEIDLITVEPCTTLDFSISREVEGRPCCVKYVNRVRGNLMESLAETNTQFMRRLNMLSCRTTRERVMAYLTSESHALGTKTFSIPMSRQELADYLCVERSALSRELGRMKSDGIIDFERSTFKLQV